MAKQKVTTTSSRTKVKITPKSSTPPGAEPCHICNGTGRVPKSWYGKKK